MTIFARYYENKKLKEYSMKDIENFITDEGNKELIANLLFHRYYDRYLKLFFYSSNKVEEYTENKNGREITKSCNVFNTEYKSGFIIMTNCCLLIETLASYFEGTNKTPQSSGQESFNRFFEKASKYKNPLKTFANISFYRDIRNGLLHQGETYGNFKIRREGKLFDRTEKAINAKLFCDHLKEFLELYKKELITEKWDGETWDRCRVKLRYIINNSK